jgi:hypothetical protein
VAGYRCRRAGGFVVLALLLAFDTRIGQLDQSLLATVISLRSPELTAFASAVTRLGSAWVVIVLGIAAAVVLGLRSAGSCCPCAAGCAGSDREPGDHPQDCARSTSTTGQARGRCATFERCVSVGHTTDGSVVVVLTAAMLALTFGSVLVRWLLMISGCVVAFLIGLQPYLSRPSLAQ